MKIAVGWPSPKDLIRNEIATLEAMKNNSSLSQAQAELVSSANEKYLYYKNRDSMATGFSFSSWVKFPESPIVKKASIECRITIKSGQPATYDMLTYSFGLFKPNGPECLLVKKFHIDYISTPSTGRPPGHPIFHLQSPGELSKMLKEKGIRDDHLEPSLSEPRLCCAPTTLALLTDFLLREFGGDRVSYLTKLSKDVYWRGLIRDNEELVLKPYFKACSRFFDDRKDKKDPEGKQLFSQDFVYGKLRQ